MDKNTADTPEPKPVTGSLINGNGPLERLRSLASAGWKLIRRFLVPIFKKVDELGTIFKGKSRKVQAVTIVILIILLAGAGTGIWWLVGRAHRVAESTAKLSVNQYVNQVHKLIDEGKYSQAETTIHEHIKINDASNAPASVKAASDESDSALLTLVDTKQSNYQAALNLDLAQAQKYGLNPSLAVAIAQLAQANHDNQTAITYYKKALDLLKPMPQIAPVTSQIDFINSQLKILQSPGK